MYSIAVDERNESAQVQLKNSLAGITVYPYIGGVLNEQGFIEDARVRVELVRKSQPNAVLYDMSLSDLNDIWKGFNKSPKGVVIPLAFKENLLLSKDAYIQLDFSWTGGGQYDTIKISENSVAQNTNLPIAFKKIQLDGDMEIDTEHYEYIFIPKTVTKIETFVDGLFNELQVTKVASGSGVAKRDQGVVSRLSADTIQNSQTATGVSVTGNCGCSGEMKRQKIEMTYEYLSFMTNNPTEKNVLFRTGANQAIKLFGSGDVILMQG